MTIPATNLSLAYATAVEVNSSDAFNGGVRARRPARLRFGAFELDPKSGELTGAEKQVVLQRQSLQVLMMLIDNCGEMVTREEIQNQLWAGDVIVDFDHSINQIIRKLRRALGDSAEQPRYVETVARRGYRLKVPVAKVEKPVPNSVSERRPGLPDVLRLSESSDARTSEGASPHLEPRLVESRRADKTSHSGQVRFCRQQFNRSRNRDRDAAMGASRTAEFDVMRHPRGCTSAAEKLDALRQMLLMVTEFADSPH